MFCRLIWNNALALLLAGCASQPVAWQRVDGSGEEDQPNVPFVNLDIAIGRHVHGSSPVPVGNSNSNILVV
jgi:hypothetical protein